MKIIGFLIRLIFVIALVVWLSDRPGTAQIAWHDTVIETSAAVLVLIVLAIAYGFVLLSRIWRFFLDSPRLWRLKRKIDKIEEGQCELDKGLSAVAAAKSAEAGRYAVKARKLLGETPATQLLLAQSAQLAGDSRAAHSIFQAMAQRPESAILGYRGLIVAALREAKYDEALRLINLYESSHKSEFPWLHLVRFEIATQRKDWDMASKALSRARKVKVLPLLHADQREAALLLAEAKKALRDSAPATALELAEKARKLRPDWVPASLILAEAQIVTKHERAALRTIEKAWRLNPHPQFVPLVYWALQLDKAVQNYRYITRIVRSQMEAFYSHMALADAALRADLWGEARRHLMTLIARGDATQMTYQMLVRVERRERKNEFAALAWQNKAVLARPDAQWLCRECGAAHENWDATCDDCHAFNRMAWDVVGQSHKESSSNKSSDLFLDDLS